MVCNVPSSETATVLLLLPSKPAILMLRLKNPDSKVVSSMQGIMKRATAIEVPRQCHPCQTIISARSFAGQYCVLLNRGWTGYLQSLSDSPASTQLYAADDTQKCILYLPDSNTPITLWSVCPPDSDRMAVDVIQMQYAGASSLA